MHGDSDLSRVLLPKETVRLSGRMDNHLLHETRRLPVDRPSCHQVGVSSLQPQSGALIQPRALVREPGERSISPGYKTHGVCRSRNRATIRAAPCRDRNRPGHCPANPALSGPEARLSQRESKLPSRSSYGLKPTAFSLFHGTRMCLPLGCVRGAASRLNRAAVGRNKQRASLP